MIVLGLTFEPVQDVAIIGFADFAKDMSPFEAVLYALPLVFRLIALDRCLSVMMTKEYSANLFSPDRIRNNHERAVKDKQRDLSYAFWDLTIGLVLVILLIALAPALRAVL